MEKEKNEKYQYIIVDYKKNNYKFFSSLDELSEIDREIFKNLNEFINTIN